jgi:Tfp pilus assembly PilM family ATPase
MSDFIAIDWEKRQLCGIEADAGKSRVRIKNCFQFVWPEQIDPLQQPKEAGEWLRGQLREAGVVGKQAMVTLPREATVVRHLELPDAPDEELPDLVRFQAASKSAVALDRLCLDYLPLQRRANGMGRDVLMATIPKEFAEAMQAVFTAAGLELVNLTITPTTTAELVARAEQHAGLDHKGGSLVIARHEQRLEISVLQHRSLLFTHSTQLVADTDNAQQTQAIQAQVSRSMVAVQKLMPDLSTDVVWLLGSEGDHNGLVEALKQRMGCDVNTLDPLASPDVKTAVREVPGEHVMYAGPVGTVLSQTGARVEHIDFLNPRRPMVAPDRRKLYAIAAGAAAVLLLAAGFGIRYVQLGNLEQVVEKQNKDLNQIDEQLKLADPSVASAALVEEWTSTNVDWLSQMQALTETMQGTERFYFSSLGFHPGKNNMLGSISADGVARTRSDVETLNADLMAAGSYGVQPNPITPGSNDGEYPFQFRLDVDLKPVADAIATEESAKTAVAGTSPSAKPNQATLNATQPGNGGAK